MTDSAEVNRIKELYSYRTQSYEPLNAWIYRTKAEREIEICCGIRKLFGLDVSRLQLLDVGSGNGDNLLFFLRLGFLPSNLFGIDLIDRRVAHAKSILPVETTVSVGNAAELQFKDSSMDLVFQSLVFSSILDENLAKRVGKEMWRVLKPGGAIIWYDFVYDNPVNRDVHGVSLKQILGYFPNAITTVKRVTLAPPISKRICTISERLYPVFNVLPFLRTHLVVILRKRLDSQ